MRKILALSLALMLALSVLSGCTSKALDKDLVILYTNDVHCAVDDNTGYAGLAAYKAELEAGGNYVALVDAGDAIQGAPIGTLSEGSYLVDLMNEVGYDVAIPGNHEFDYGMDTFLTLANEKAAYPYAACNFMDLKTGSTVFPSYVIKEYGGVKVAFVGICTPKTITTSTPAYFQDANGEFIYGFCQDESGKALYDQVQGAVDAARKAGAAYVVAVAHLGISEDTKPWMSTEVIGNTTGIDVMIDGHSHSELECERVRNADGEFVPLTSTGTKLNNIGMLVISKGGSISTGLVSGYSEKDAAIEAYIKTLQSDYEAVLKTVVAKTEVALTINDPVTGVRIVRNAETNLGDLCADAYRWVTGADVAFINGGGVRADIAAGDITYNDVLTVHPFGNAVCMVEATGQEILDALEMGARSVPSESGGFLQVSGLSYEVHTGIASAVVLDENGMFVKVDGDYRVQNVMVGSEPLDLSKTYTLACHDYLLKNAGDGYTMFQDNTLLLDSVMLDNQGLISYLTEGLEGIVGNDYSDPYGQGRIVELP